MAEGQRFELCSLAVERQFDHKKLPQCETVLFSNGGGTEIRTLGTLRHGSFQDCCNQPLCHPSGCVVGEVYCERRFCQKYFSFSFFRKDLVALLFRVYRENLFLLTGFPPSPQGSFQVLLHLTRGARE